MFGVTLVSDKIKMAFCFRSGYDLSPLCAKQTSTPIADVGMYGICCDNTFTASESTRVAIESLMSQEEQEPLSVSWLSERFHFHLKVFGLQLDRKSP